MGGELSKILPISERMCEIALKRSEFFEARQMCEIAPNCNHIYARALPTPRLDFGGVRPRPPPWWPNYKFPPATPPVPPRPPPCLPPPSPSPPAQPPPGSPGRLIHASTAGAWRSAREKNAMSCAKFAKFVRFWRTSKCAKYPSRGKSAKFRTLKNPYYPPMCGGVENSWVDVSYSCTCDQYVYSCSCA